MNRDVYSVKQLNTELRNLLEASYRSIWIEGEISGLANPASGHKYFSLKEDNSIVRCAFFKNRQNRGSVTVSEGMQVLVRGQISYYEPRGDLQFIVSHLEDAGEGALARAFELLKKKLDSEGLFSQQHKKELPHYPETIGIVTSPSGAALQDILATLIRRYALANVVVYPTLVQGTEAPKQIVEALLQAENHNKVDVIIIARGGGSLEDLHAFNDESVARAIFNCPIPIVSGVGHEIDFSIADFVSDQRAATPTAAAEMVTPHLDNIKQAFASLRNQIILSINNRLQEHRQTIDYTASRLIHPAQKLKSYRQENLYLNKQLSLFINQYLNQMNSQLGQTRKIVSVYSPMQQFSLLQQRLVMHYRTLKWHTDLKVQDSQRYLIESLDKIKLISPQHTLDRGYAIVQNKKQGVVHDPALLQPKDKLNISVSKGNFTAIVENLE